MSSLLAVVAVESSGGSEESEPLPVDFCGEPAFVIARDVRSTRPDRLEVAEEICGCGCGCVVRAREDRRAEVSAISRRPIFRIDQEPFDTNPVANRSTLARHLSRSESSDPVYADFVFFENLLRG